MDQIQNWGRRLENVLKQQKRRASDVARALGVSPAAVTKWTSGGDIKYSNLLQLASLLCCNWVWLRFGYVVVCGPTTSEQSTAVAPPRGKREAKAKAAELRAAEPRKAVKVPPPVLKPERDTVDGLLMAWGGM